MIELIYDPCFLYSSSSLGIIRMQIDDILILADNNFASTKENAIRLAKIMTKNKEHLTSAHLLKFNGVQIKLNLNRIVLTKESYVKEILLITDHAADFTSLRGIIKKKLSSKEQCLA